MTINWIKNGNELISSCGMYKLINRGEKGGTMYAVMSKRHDMPIEDCYCRVEKVGTFEECKGFEARD